MSSAWNSKILLHVGTKRLIFVTVAVHHWDALYRSCHICKKSFNGGNFPCDSTAAFLRNGNATLNNPNNTSVFKFRS